MPAVDSSMRPSPGGGEYEASPLSVVAVGRFNERMCEKNRKKAKRQSSPGLFAVTKTIVSRRKGAVKQFDQLGFGRQADDLVQRLLPALEHQHAGNRGHVVFDRQIGILIDVDFADFHFAGELVGNLVDGRTQLTTRAAPGRPKIDEDRLGGFPPRPANYRM